MKTEIDKIYEYCRQDVKLTYKLHSVIKTKKKDIEVSLLLLTESQYDDLLACAFEGGSNYWYTIEKFERPRQKESGLHYVNRLPVVTNEKALEGGRVPKKTKIITLLDCDIAFRKIRETYPKVYANIKEENYDASDADIFLQMIVLDEVIYG